MADGPGGVPGGVGGAGISMSTVPLWTTEVILLIAALPPKACRYFVKTSSAAGSAGAGAAAGFGGTGPVTTVAGAMLGSMLGSIAVMFLTARAGKISAAVCSVGDFSPGKTNVGAPLAAPRWQV